MGRMVRILHATCGLMVVGVLGCGPSEGSPASPSMLGARGPETTAQAQGPAPQQASPPATQRAQQAPQQAQPGAASEVRIATLNVRWFPDGDARGPGARTTDVDTLAASLAGLHVQAVGLQEILVNDRAERALTRLRSRLDALTQGRWEVVLDDCPADDGRQHVALLYDASRAERLAVRRVDGFGGNERGDGCAGYMRPGLGVALRFASGFDAWLVVVHLDSGTDDRAFERRARAYETFAGLQRELSRAHGDRDVIVLGDFNTMGNDRGVRGLDEVAALERVLDGASFRRLWLEPGCTEVGAGRVSMLDHIVVSSSTEELAPSSRASVAGPCGQSRCRVSRSDPWLAHVSDHCPVVATFDGRDLD